MNSDEIRRCLDDAGWSQRELARRLEWDEREVRRWCQGTAQVPPVVAVWITLVARFHREHPAPRVPRDAWPELSANAEPIPRENTEP